MKGKKVFWSIVIQHTLYLLIWIVFVYNSLKSMTGQTDWIKAAGQELWIAYITGIIFVTALAQVKEIRARESGAETEFGIKGLAWRIVSNAATAVLIFLLYMCPVRDHCGFLWVLWPLMGLAVIVMLLDMQRNG